MMRWRRSRRRQVSPIPRASSLQTNRFYQHGIESVTAVALAYVMAKTPYVFPIVGGRKVEHLKDNIQALSIKLSQEQIDKLEQASPFTQGFPQNVSAPDALRHAFPR